MNTPSELIKIHVFRPLDGIRAPYTILLDRFRNVVSDELDEEGLARIKSNPLVLARHTISVDGQPAPAAPRGDLLQQQGLHKHITDNGIVISREPPDEWSLKFEDWLSEDQPNHFEGSEELRAEYFAERDEVQGRINAGHCPGCELTRLQVVYRIKLRELVKE